MAAPIEHNRVKSTDGKTDQLSSFFYDDGENGELLCSINNKVQGFASDFTEGKKGETLVLTRVGGLKTDKSGNIVKEWKFNPKAQGAGTPPSEPIEIQLNNYFSFKFTNRKEISVQLMLRGEGISHTFECGEILRRHDTYMDNNPRNPVVKGKFDISECV